MLRAVLFDQEDIRIEEAPIPEILPEEVLVKNKVSTTCGTDVKNYKRGYPLLKPPHLFGHEFSGEIVEVGSMVKGFKEGDRVAVHNTAPCNRCYYCKNGQESLCESLTFNRGTYAEFVKVPAPIVQQNMFVLPDSMNHKIASLLEPFSCAVYGIEECEIHLGDTIVINGAGPIGLMFTKLAALKGAKTIVTDLEQSRLNLALQLGAYKVLNLAGIENPVEVVIEETNNHRGADIVIEATGLIKVWENSLGMVRKGGTVLLFGGTKSGTSLAVDATRLHYSQLTIKGIFHTTPRHVERAFTLLKMGMLKDSDFIQNEYRLQDLEQAIIEHALHKVIKNAIVYK